MTCIILPRHGPHRQASTSRPRSNSSHVHDWWSQGNLQSSWTELTVLVPCVHTILSIIENFPCADGPFPVEPVHGTWFNREHRHIQTEDKYLHCFHPVVHWYTVLLYDHQHNKFVIDKLNISTLIYVYLYILLHAST